MNCSENQDFEWKPEVNLVGKMRSGVVETYTSVSARVSLLETEHASLGTADLQASDARP